MRNLIIALFLFFGTSELFYAQTVFSVKPGFNLTGASIGRQFNKLQPYAGIAMAGVKMTYEDDVSSSEEVVKLNLYLPHIGVKVRVAEKESLKGALNFALIKPIVSGKEDYGDNSDTYLEDEINRINLWGTETGYIAEYFISDHFSVGGEFGIRYMFCKYDYEETEKYVQKLNLKMTYALASLNFYF